MKKFLQILSIVVPVLLCIGVLFGCGRTAGIETSPSSDTAAIESVAGSEPFAAPGDQVGKVVAADGRIVTWQAYAFNDTVIDFMGVDVKQLKDPSQEMTIVYLEDDVSYYLIKDGKLVDAAAEDVVPGSVIGITTLEAGVQDIYILYTPALIDTSGSEGIEGDDVEDIFDNTDTTAATEETWEYEEITDTQPLEDPEV